MNRLVLNTVWSQRANFIEVPTDCPQRDERLGWTGDAQVFAGTACWLADSHAFLRKYLRDVMADQRADGAIPHFSPDPTRLHPVPGRGEWAGSTGWGDAIAIIPWQLYLHYGDEDVLARVLPGDAALARLPLVDLGRADHHARTPSGAAAASPSATGSSPGAAGPEGQPEGRRRPSATTRRRRSTTSSPPTSWPASPRVLGEEPGRRGASPAAPPRSRQAFAHEFITPRGRVGSGDQTSYALALLHDLVPDEHRRPPPAISPGWSRRPDGCIGTGFIGTPALLPALTKLGLHDLAARSSSTSASRAGSTK